MLQIFLLKGYFFQKKTIIRYNFNKSLLLYYKVKPRKTNTLNSVAKTKID